MNMRRNAEHAETGITFICLLNNGKQGKHSSSGFSAEIATSQLSSTRYALTSLHACTACLIKTTVHTCISDCSWCLLHHHASVWHTWYFAGVGSFADAMLPPSPGLLPPSPQGLPGMQTPEAAAEDAGRHTLHHDHSGGPAWHANARGSGRRRGQAHFAS